MKHAQRIYSADRACCPAACCLGLVAGKRPGRVLLARYDEDFMGMFIYSRIPDYGRSVCPYCSATVTEPASPAAQAPCPQCGHRGLVLPDLRDRTGSEGRDRGPGEQ